MESEIQFLLKILLEHKLRPEVKKLFLARIGEVETAIREKQITPHRTMIQSTHSNQAPSTQRILDSMPAESGPLPPEVIAASPAAAMALQARNQVMLGAGKTEPGRSSPRKF